MRLKTYTVTTTTKVRGFQCQRCGHVWAPKIKDVRICPKCKSARFDQPLKRTA